MDKKYAIFLDIDGTLMSHGVVPQKNKDVIAQVQEMGHKVFINTGRSYACIPGNVLEEIQFDGVVCGIGADVRYGNEILRSITFTEEQLRELTEYYLATDKQCIIEGEERMYYINPSDPQDKLIIRISSDFSNRYSNSKVSNFTIPGTMSNEERIMLDKDFVYWEHGSYYEFTRKGCTKASGMKVVLDRLSLGRENCIAMGDSNNDIDMLLCAGISVAMDNSTDYVKQICGYVTDSVENAGVATALERLIINLQSF